MPRYGESLYGADLYGSDAVLTDTVTWIVQVDWDGDGTLDGANEGDYMIDCPIKLGREEYLDGSGNGFDHMRVGTATVTLDNASGRFDPRDSGSALYPNVKPGKKIQIRVRDNSDESVYTQFSGTIDDIEVKGYRKTVILHCVDYMQHLVDQELDFDAELFNTTITGAIDHLLTQANYPGGRLLQVDAQPVWVFAVNGQSAAQVAHQVADAGLGMFWVDQYGRARYQERNHPTSGNNLNQTYFLKDIEVSQPWDGVYNDVSVTARRFIKLPAAIIFTLPEAIYIANGNSETITVNYDPSTDVQLRSLEANTRADGEGTELTFTASEIDLGLTGGTLTVTNSSGSNGYLLEVRIRGRRYDDLEQKYTAADATSQGTYGLRKFRLESPYLQDRNFASGFATILVGFLKDDRASLVVQMRGRPTWQFYKELMTFVNFSSTTLNISSTSYQIIGLEHHWNSDNGQDVTTTWYLHRTLVDTTSITSSSIETAPKVPPAPDGYEDPGGDPDTITPEEELPPESPETGLDHIYVVNTTFSSSGQLSFGDFLDWEQPVYVSDDISLTDVWKVASPSRLYLTLPGWYEVTVSGFVAHGSGVSSTVRFWVDLYEYNEFGSGGFFQTITKFRRNSFSAGEYDPIAGHYTFPRIVGGETISYLRIKLEDLYPTISTFFTNSRQIELTVTVKRVRRLQEES